MKGECVQAMLVQSARGPAPSPRSSESGSGGRASDSRVRRQHWAAAVVVAQRMQRREVGLMWGRPQPVALEERQRQLNHGEPAEGRDSEKCGWMEGNASSRCW